MLTPLDLAKSWVIGGKDWPDYDYTSVLVARTKTAARQAAERELARVLVSWGKHERGCRKAFEEQQERRDGFKTFDAYANAYKDKGLPGVPLKYYCTVRDGIMLYGPNGEKLHIAKPSKAALNRIAKRERNTNAILVSMAKSLEQATKE